MRGGHANVGAARLYLVSIRDGLSLRRHICVEALRIVNSHFIEKTAQGDRNSHDPTAAVPLPKEE
jgi:hypothetical protein